MNHEFQERVALVPVAQIRQIHDAGPVDAPMPTANEGDASGPVDTQGGGGAQGRQGPDLSRIIISGVGRTKTRGGADG